MVPDLMKQSPLGTYLEHCKKGDINDSEVHVHDCLDPIITVVFAQ